MLIDQNQSMEILKEHHGGGALNLIQQLAPINNQSYLNILRTNLELNRYKYLINMDQAENSL